MKRFALFAAIWFAAGIGLQAITIGDTEVDLGADLRTRYQDFDGDDVGDFGALDARWRLWASADITDAISVATRLNVAEGELGGGSDDPGSIRRFAFNGTNSQRAVEFAYITWHNEWGDVYVGRIPAAMVGNDLLLDSFRYDGWSGAYEGAFVNFSDFGGFDLDFFYIDDNTASSTEDQGMGIGVVVGFGEMIGWDLAVGFAEYDDDMTGTGEEYTAIFANANVALSDVAVVDLSWIDGDGGNTGAGPTMGAQGNAFLARIDYEINEELGIAASYGKVEPGAIFDSGCSGNSGAVCGGFGWESSIMRTHGGIGSEYIGMPSSFDGNVISFALSWGENWTFSYIDWDDDLNDYDNTVLRLEHNVTF